MNRIISDNYLSAINPSLCTTDKSEQLVIVGVVHDVGPDCTEFKVGDRVVSMHWAQDSLWPCPLGEGITTSPNDTFFGLTIDGGYAEYATNHESAFAKVPDGWSPIEAAPVMSTFGTFWMGAVVRAGAAANPNPKP